MMAWLSALHLRHRSRGTDQSRRFRSGGLLFWFATRRDPERGRLTWHRPLSHRAYARRDGLYSLCTRLDFDRPTRIDPTHCDGRSDHSRL